MKRYVGLAHQTKTGWSLSFPDFPGCVTGTADFEAVLISAAEILRLHVAGMIADGATVPEPLSVEVLRDRPALADVFEGAVVVTIPLLP